MRDAGTHFEDLEEQPSVAPATTPRPGMFKDPAVMRMTYIAIGLVILFLASLVGVLISGVTNPTGPRTLAENEALVSGDAVRAGSTDPAVWGQYIAALISSGQNGRAENMIAQAKSSVEDSGTAEIVLAEARLEASRKDYEKVIESADAGMKQITAFHDAVIKAGGSAAQRATLDGLHENYYLLTLLKAEAYRELGQWSQAISQYDVYIARNPGAADILVDRGNAKIEVKDTKGAEADFRKALEFLPGSDEALAGLKKIGAAAK